jgi:copper(I)-binding protein
MMLIGLKAPLNADENYQVILTFEKAGKVNLTGLAKRPADLKMPDAGSTDAHSPSTHSMDMQKSN